MAGLEPARPSEHQHLKLASLPIPAHPRMRPILGHLDIIAGESWFVKPRSGARRINLLHFAAGSLGEACQGGPGARQVLRAAEVDEFLRREVQVGGAGAPGGAAADHQRGQTGYV